MSFMVMTRQGIDLCSLFRKRKAVFTAEQIYSLGIQIVNIMEQIHDAGYVFNDLKLDNLVLPSNLDSEQLINTQEDIFDTNEVTMIDFGYASTYLDKNTNQHAEK